MQANAMDRFFDVPVEKRATSRGVIDLPIFYRDFAYVHLLFWADYEKAAAKLADTAFVPCRFFQGKAGAVVSFFQYRASAIGPYNEVAVSLFAHPRGAKRTGPFLPQLLRDARTWTMGAYVVDLPVTTELAWAAGKDVWSYPKFVTAIAFHLEGRRFRGVVDDPDLGEPLLAIDGDIGALGPGVRLSNASIVSYATHDGVPLRIHHDVDARYKVNLGFSGALQVNEKSRHVMARDLVEMGLRARAPFLVMHCDKARMVLHEGVAVEERVVRKVPVAGAAP
jgi:Acetoacetate decarboxylase (ADC)